MPSIFCTLGTPGTMTSFSRPRQGLAFYNSGFPTEARVIMSSKFWLIGRIWYMIEKLEIPTTRRG